MPADRLTRLRRRDLLRATAGAAAGGSGLAGLRPAPAASGELPALLDERVGRAKPKEGRVVLTLPDVAEDGSSVPIEVSVESPMTEADHVKTIHIFADGNPQAEVVSFHFTPACGRAAASTRMRLAKTQNVIALAETSDGSLYRTSREVQVTIGGCTG
jgi:sulfur-oxidizing protein SoxY